MSQTPIISAHQLREYVRQQNVAPEAATALKMMMQAAAQIDQLASAAMQWQDQTSRVAELQGLLTGAEEELDRVGELCRAIDLQLNGPRAGAERGALADLLEQLRDGGWKLTQREEADELPGTEPAPSVNFRELVDELCVRFGIERYDDVMPTMTGLLHSATTSEQGLQQRDRTIETLDAELVTAQANHQQAKQDYARLHQLLDDICEKSTIPGVRFDQLPAAAEKFAELFNATLDAAGVDGQDADDLPQEVRALKESHRTATAQRDELRKTLNRVALALGLPTDPAPTVQELVEAITELLGSDNVTSPALDASWLNDAIDLCHAVAGDLSRENVIMARAARSLIQTAPRGEHE